MATPTFTTKAGEQRYGIYIYADAETKAALYQLALQQGWSQSQVVCDLIKEAMKGKKKWKGNLTG